MHRRQLLKVLGYTAAAGLLVVTEESLRRFWSGWRPNLIDKFAVQARSPSHFQISLFDGSRLIGTQQDIVLYPKNGALVSDCTISWNLGTSPISNIRAVATVNG